MNLEQTMMTFEEATEKIQKAIAIGLVSPSTRTKLMQVIRSRQRFVVGVSERVSRLNDNIVIVSEKDFDDIFPQSADKSVFVGEE